MLPWITKQKDPANELPADKVFPEQMEKLSKYKKARDTENPNVAPEERNNLYNNRYFKNGEITSRQLRNRKFLSYE